MPQYDQLDHPELDLASLDKAYDKLEGEEHSTFPELEYFGQMHGTHLLPKAMGGLYIIDQHAAQERVKYEEYRESIGNVDGSQQQLLVPYIFGVPCRRSDPPATAQTPPRGSGRLFRRVWS